MWLAETSLGMKPEIAGWLLMLIVSGACALA
jgi:hypothetical protein